ncbi:hypothetical protein [Geodermatophilus sp. SYSU D01119]
MPRPVALLVVTSTQLAAQAAGHAVALRRRRAFDVPFLAGSPEHLVRDWLWFGTAYSAPPYLLGRRPGRSGGCCADRTTARGGCCAGSGPA